MVLRTFGPFRYSPFTFTIPYVDPEILVAAVLIAFLAAICSSLTGFGFALTMVPLFALTWDVELAIATTVLLAVLNSAALLFEVRGHFEPSRVAVLLLGYVIGFPLGILLLESLDTDSLKVMVAATVLVTGLALFFLPAYEIRRGATPLGVTAGVASGVLGPTTSMIGPPVIIYLLGRHPAIEAFRSTTLAFFLPSGILTAIIFVALGRINQDVLITAAVCLPGIVLGGIAGSWLRRHLSQERFRVLVLAVLVLSSLAVLLSAVI
jgi:uncharacterized membrane protein YfcA